PALVITHAALVLAHAVLVVRLAAADAARVLATGDPVHHPAHPGSLGLPLVLVGITPPARPAAAILVPRTPSTIAVVLAPAVPPRPAAAAHGLLAIATEPAPILTVALALLVPAPAREPTTHAAVAFLVLAPAREPTTHAAVAFLVLALAAEPAAHAALALLVLALAAEPAAH